MMKLEKKISKKKDQFPLTSQTLGLLYWNQYT